MTDGFLSQEEIDSLLNGSGSANDNTKSNDENMFSDLEKDLLGEIGNISMGSAATALSQVINQPVNITTPVVSVTTLKEIKKDIKVPNIALDIKYIEGIAGENILVMKVTDAGVIANLMMGGDGKVELQELSEIEISAVQEAMNQMIGSSATSMSTMLGRYINISPPVSKIWHDNDNNLSNTIEEEEHVVKVLFRMTIGDLIDSNIMQVLPIHTARSVCSIMMGEEPEVEVQETVEPEVSYKMETVEPAYEAKAPEIKPTVEKQNVEINKASFQPLHQEKAAVNMPNNIDLILDVPLDISVVLGRTKMNIRDILALNTGSLIELDKLAEEPVEVLVNGKKVAYGEVVVVDENFGVRITNIVSGEERVKALKGKK